MPTIAWDEGYSIGVPQIDEHHQHLFFLFNKFHEIFVKDAPGQNLSPLFDELIDYVIYHFDEEERLMQECRFPHYEMHRKEHEIFSQRLVELDKQYSQKKKHLLIEVVVFLHNWLKSHIMQSDADFGRFIALDYNAVSRNRNISKTTV